MLVKIKKIITTIAATLMATLCVVGCGGISQNGGTNTNNPPVLNEPVLELEVGETFDLDVLNLSGGYIEWTSNRANVISVDKNGVVTANAPGEATITAKFNGKTLTCTVKSIIALHTAYVFKLANVEQTDGKYALRLIKGTSFDFEAILSGCEDNVTITATSNEQTNVSVNGLSITANNVTETAKITFSCEYQGKSYQIECSVIVEEVFA